MGNKTSSSRKSETADRRRVLENERIKQQTLATERIQQYLARIQQQELVHERIQQQDAIIEQLKQQIQTADRRRVLENERIKQQELATARIQQDLATERIQQQVLVRERIQQQDAIIEQLKQQIRTQEVARRTERCTQATQTNKNDVYVGNHHAVLHRTPSLTVYSSEYYHHVTDIWQYVFIERSVHAEPMGNSNEAHIQVFTASKRTWSSGPKRIIQRMIPRLQPGEKIYYHASSDSHVKSIIENGIDVSKSTRPTDFSCGGFYVTKNFGKAVEWSKRRAKWDKGRPAVIAFKISRSLRKEEPHIALKVDSSTNRKWWECVVSHFRNSEMSPDVHKVLADVKFIKGPVANNKYVGFDENPRPFDFTQLCIRDEEYARRFGSLQNIAFVIFGVNK